MALPLVTIPYLQLQLGILLDQLGGLGGLRLQLDELPVVQAAEGRSAGAVVSLSDHSG